MQDDRVELFQREEPVAAHRRILGARQLERAAGEIAGEDDVDDVLLLRARPSARSSRRCTTGPSTGISSSMPISSKSSRCSASTRLSPESTPPPGRSQYSLPGLLVPAEQDLVVPAAGQRRDADPRLAASRAGRADARARPAPNRAARRRLAARPRAPPAARAARSASPARPRTARSRSVLRRTTISSPR